jgi:L-fuconolactonase
VIVDAHHHYWRSSSLHPALARPYEPADLPPVADATVLVQCDDDNVQLASYAAEVRTVAGVVASLDASFDGIPKLVGVRRLVGREPLDWLDAGRFAELAARGLAWDVVVVTDAQARAVCALAEAVPELRVVVDHLARPPVEAGPFEPWASRVRALAARPNIALKVSIGIDALVAWDAWGDVSRYVDHALECFGAPRLMLASNWPVVTLRASYSQAWDDLAAACGHDPEVLGGTAMRWYRLQT